MRRGEQAGRWLATTRACVVIAALLAGYMLLLKLGR